MVMLELAWSAMRGTLVLPQGHRRYEAVGTRPVGAAGLETTGAAGPTVLLRSGVRR